MQALDHSQLAGFTVPGVWRRLLVVWAAWLGCVATSAFGATTILDEGFEGNFPEDNGWAVGDAMPLGSPAYWDDVNAAFGSVWPGTPLIIGLFSKGYCAGVGHGGTDEEPTYRNDMYAYMSKTINLAGYSKADLFFYSMIPSIESCCDSARVYMDNTVIWSSSSSGITWEGVSLSLDDYLGSSHTLKFAFLSDESGVAEGWYLDVIEVTADVCSADIYEPDDTAEAAKGLADWQTQNRWACPRTEDWAWFRLDGPANVLVRTRLETTGFPYLEDTEMWLYGPGSATNELAYNNDVSFTDRGSQIEINCLPAGMYYVRIRERGGQQFRYTLDLDLSEPTCPDAYEADNTADTAKTIADGETQNHTIYPAGDEDWVRFTLNGPGSVLARTGLRSGSTGGDTAMWLYGPDPSTNQVAYNDDANGLWSEIQADSLPAGRYYVRVQTPSASEVIPGYTLFLDINDAICPDAYEPDDTPNTASEVAIGGMQERAIYPAGNGDWAKFTLDTPGDIQVWTEPRSGCTGGDTEMWLYGPDSPMDLVAYNDDYLRPGSWSEIAGEGLAAGTYYVRVLEHGNDAAIPGYTLWVDRIQEPVADRYEPDNTAGSAKLISDGHPQVRSLTLGDQDWAKFTLTNASHVLLQTGPRTGFTGGDTRMWLYGPNSSTSLVASNDDFNGLWSEIQTNCLPPGTYYVRVLGGLSGVAGYTLFLDITEPGMAITETGGTTEVTEGGAGDSYKVALQAQPSNNVTITLTVPAAQLQVSPANLTFSPANWNVAQVVTVSAVDDSEEEGSHTAAITHVASQAQANCIGARTLVVSILDNDQITLGHLEVFRFLDSVRLVFDSVPYHYYQIEHCATLAPPTWQVLTNNVPGDGAPLEIMDSLEHATRFYRLKERPSPWP